MAKEKTGRDDQSSRTFARELDKHVVHEDVTPQMKKRLKRQRPDRVIGLAPTRTFKRLLPSLRSRCSPFKKKNVLYPFIVIEAKSAENNSSASFGSMLRQTAFVVRTCLRLQQNLRKESGVEHQCLVWNFLIMGEEWRLYAGVPKGEGVVSLKLCSYSCFQDVVLTIDSNSLIFGMDRWSSKMGHFNYCLSWTISVTGLVTCIAPASLLV